MKDVRWMKKIETKMEKKLWIYAGKTSIIIKVIKKITYCFCKT